MPRLLLRVAVLAPLVLLAACAGGPPWPISQSAHGIALRWYADDVGNARVDQIAAAHCAGVGRNAVLTRAERDGSIAIADYACR